MKIKAIFVVFFFTLLSSTAFAGSTANLEMSVMDNAMYGALGDIHKSSDAVQRMSVIDRGSSMLVFGCDSNNTCKVCTTQDPQHIAQLRGANSDAYVNVGFENGVCDYVSTMNTSTFSNK